MTRKLLRPRRGRKCPKEKKFSAQNKPLKKSCKRGGESPPTEKEQKKFEELLDREEGEELESLIAKTKK